MEMHAHVPKIGKTPVHWSDGIGSTQLAFQINAIELTEGFLLAAYREHLPAIRAAANGER